MWKTIMQEFVVKSSNVVAAMWTSFKNIKCADGGNVQTHLDKLRFKYEELVGIGVIISTMAYTMGIIGSLPSHYQHHLLTIEALERTSTLTTSVTAKNSQILTTTFSISPELVIQLATEEYHRIQSAPGHRGPKMSKANTGVAILVQGTTSSG